MLPWLIMAAASLLSQKQKEKQQQESLLMDQYRKNAQEAGGSTRMADVMGGERAIQEQGADYGPALLSLVGKATGGDDEDELRKRSAVPRSGVRLRMEDF